ncbi:hypothetical protein ACO0LH_16645 [Undibacterium sp. TJN19]
MTFFGLGFLLPVLLGCLLSFWIVGKRNSLLWVIPFLMIRLLTPYALKITGISGDGKITMGLLASEWIIAAGLIIFACVLRLCRPPATPIDLAQTIQTDRSVF